MAKKTDYYQRPDGVYEKKITDPATGKRIYFRSKDWREIDRKILAYHEKQETGPDFAEIAEKWHDEHFPTLAHSTQRGYAPAYQRIKKEFGPDKVKDITSQRISNYLKRFSKGRGFKTATNELLIVRMILEYACLWDTINQNPADHVRVPKGLSRAPREFPSDTDILAVKASHAVCPPYGLLHYFALYTGARVGELIALKWADVNMDSREIHIRQAVYWERNRPKSKGTKTDAGERDVPILQKLFEVLEPMNRPAEQYIFAVDGKLPTEMALFHGRKRYQRETGVCTTPHQLRHAYATMLFEAGIDEKTSQYLLGHAQLSTTMDIYTALRKRKVVEAAKKLNDLDIITY